MVPPSHPDAFVSFLFGWPYGTLQTFRHSLTLCVASYMIRNHNALIILTVEGPSRLVRTGIYWYVS